MVQYDSKTQKPYVEIQTGDQEFERRDIELGLSNGIFVEVKSGIAKEDQIKVWNALKPVAGPENYGG